MGKYLGNVLSILPQATFRGHKLRTKPAEVRGQMLTIGRPRQTNPDLVEERERQYREAVLRDVTGTRDVTGLSTAGQPRREHKVTGGGGSIAR